jgi:glucosamine-6-phosphate deaminase
MSVQIPEYLAVEGSQLGQGTPVKVRIIGDMDDVARDIAQVMLQAADDARAEGRAATMIVPVGPVDQYPVLAEMINKVRADFRDVMLINMDEYLTDDDQWVDLDHPLGFRGFMNRRFYDLIDAELAPKPENRVYPDPNDRGAIARIIDRRGGVDVCFGGIGINGHMAFNEPPEPGEVMSAEEFAALPTRVLNLSRETKTINSVTVGGETSLVPNRAITVGMKEILESRKCRFYCNRPWQRSVVRRVLHGPVTSACPASLLRTHADAEITIADFVAEVPEIQLR